MEQPINPTAFEGGNPRQWRMEMSEELNNNPKPINPEEILAEDGGATAEDVQTPNASAFTFGDGHSQPLSGRQLSSAPFEDSFSNESVPQHIERVKGQLGTISRFIQGHAVEKIQRKHVIKLTAALFDYQYQDMRHLLLLSMDAQKTRRFVQYLEATDEIRTKLQEQSAQAQLAIVDTMFDQRLAAFRAQQNRDGKSTSAFKRGEMNRAQYDRALSNSQELTDRHEESLNNTAAEMITRHIELLFETLSLFKTDLIKSGRI